MFPKIVIFLFGMFIAISMYSAANASDTEPTTPEKVGPCAMSQRYADMTDAQLDYQRTLPLHKEDCVPADRRK